MQGAEAMSGKLFAKAVLVTAVSSSVASLVLFIAFPLGAFLDFGWRFPAVLCWDAGLSLLFFAQHSGMIRSGFRARPHVADHYQGAVNAIALGVTLFVVVLLWQASDASLYVLEGHARLAAHAGALVAAGIFVWGVVVLRSASDLVGARAIRAYLRSVRMRPVPFVVRGPYRWCRHPLYFAVLVLFWSNPDMTADRMLFNVLWTAWIFVGARLEERDLLAEFGEKYENYQRKVPALLPWRGPVKI